MVLPHFKIETVPESWHSSCSIRGDITVETGEFTGNVPLPPPHQPLPTTPGCSRLGVSSAFLDSCHLVWHTWPLIQKNSLWIKVLVHISCLIILSPLLSRKALDSLHSNNVPITRQLLSINTKVRMSMWLRAKLNFLKRMLKGNH